MSVFLAALDVLATFIMSGDAVAVAYSALSVTILWQTPTPPHPHRTCHHCRTCLPCTLLPLFTCRLPTLRTSLPAWFPLPAPPPLFTLPTLFTSPPFHKRWLTVVVYGRGVRLGWIVFSTLSPGAVCDYPGLRHHLPRPHNAHARFVTFLCGRGYVVTRLAHTPTV